MTNGYDRLERGGDYGGQMLQNYQLLRDILNPKFTESQQHFQYRQWLESLSRYELEARQPLDDNLKIATLVNGLRWQTTTTSAVVGQTDFCMAECERDSGELLQLYLCSQSYHWSYCLPSTWLP